MNLKPEELIREAMRANPEEGIKELRKKGWRRHQPVRPVAGSDQMELPVCGLGYLGCFLRDDDGRMALGRC